MNKSENITTIAGALVKAQRSMGNATKDSKNPFFKSTYATLNAVREACIPALNEQGISVLQPTSVIEGKLYVETLLLHESGEFISGLYEVVVGKQNDPQSLGSSISYSRRYGLQAMVNIGAEDDDGEKAHGRGATKSLAQITTDVNHPNNKLQTKGLVMGTVNPANLIDNRTGVTDAAAAADQVKVYENKEVVAPPKKGFGVKAGVAKTETETGDGWS